MGPYRAAAAEAEPARAQAGRCDARGSERDPLHDALGWWLAHAAEGLSPLADRILVVPPFREIDAVPHHPRHRRDDGPGTSGPRSQPERRGDRQPDSESPG